MALSRTTTLQREEAPAGPASDWLDPSSAWLRDERALILPIESEPYDWSLDEGAEDRYPQYIPIPPPIQDDLPIQPEPGCEVIPLEQAALILVEEILARKSEAELNPIDQALPREDEKQAYFTYIIRNKTERGRKHLISSVLLLMFAVILLFVFAYIAQR